MKKILLTILLLSLFIPNLANAYPPDNAAVLYYKLAAGYPSPVDEGLKQMWDQIKELPTSKESPSDEVKQFIERQRAKHIIQELEIASHLEHCDWGYDLSQGFEVRLPVLGRMKDFGLLILADGAISVDKGDILTALDKNLVARRMACHVSDTFIITYMTAYGMTKESNDALQHILATHPIDEAALAKFKEELLLEPYRPLSFMNSLILEKKSCLLEISKMTPERFKKNFGSWDVNEEEEPYKRILKPLEKGDPAFIERSAAYMEKWSNDNIAAIEKPYAQAYTEIRATFEKAVQDAKVNDAAVLTSVFSPSLGKVYNYSICWKTEYDAMLTALDVYIVAAKTGKLPTELPESTYIDHFSGKPFIYAITEDGFTLKCQQEDLVKKKVHEFHYKLPK